MKRKLFLVILSILIIVLAGCSKQPEKTVDSKILDKIEIKVLSVSKLPEGNGYSLKLINSSPYLIKQNSVYISYPIKNGNGLSLNKCKVEANGNKLDIKPKEEVILNVLMNNENFQDNKMLDTENPDIQIEGYINEVKEINHFEKSGSFEYFDSEFKRKN